MRINLGGGKLERPGFVNLDPVHGQGPWKRMAQDAPWPCADGSVEEIYASHVLEHIPAGEARIAVFNEAWRVLGPDCPFRIRVPLFPYWQAMADPTHVSYWTPQSFGYFDGSVAYDADYGILPWTTIRFWTEGDWEGHWVGVKRILPPAGPNSN